MTTSTRRLALLAGAALAASALPALTTAGAATAATSTTFTKDLSYTCNVTAIFPGGDLSLNIGSGFTVDIKATFAVPDGLYPGQVVPPVKVGVDLTLDEALRTAAVNLLAGVEAEGAATDVPLTVTTAGGATTTYRIPSLAAGRSPIPQADNSPWVIPASGTTPAIDVPSTSSITIGAPSAFTIKANIYEKDDAAMSQAILDCIPDSAKTKDLTLATLPVRKLQPAMTAAVTNAPVRAGSTHPSLLIRTNSLKQASGRVNVYTEDGRTIAAGLLNARGDVRLVLPTFGKRGNRVLTVDYVGDTSNSARSVTTVFAVR